MENQIGYIKYTGDSVKDGTIDARKAAQALLWFDEALRYSINSQNPELAITEYELPVFIKKGSWEIIPQTIGELISAGAVIVGTTYCATAATQLAQNDFKDKKTVDVLKWGLKGLFWVVKIAKHLWEMGRKKLTDIEFLNKNEDLRLTNHEGKMLIVPRQYLELYSNCPKWLLAKVSSVIETERELEIGIIESDGIQKTNIWYSEKSIFYFQEDASEVVFPELTHGMSIEIEGKLTRWNENTNAMGFLYQGIVLTCHPLTWSIVQHKDELFSKCRIKWVVDRRDKMWGITEKKPKIIFESIIAIAEDEWELLSLF